VNSDQLLGGPGTRPAAVDALAARTLVKGEALTPPAGRADDFMWPRREVGREQAKGDVPVANAAPGTPGAAVPGTPGTAPNAALAPPKPAAPKKPPVQQTNPFGNFFGGGFGNPAPPPRQIAPPPPRAPGGPPRPPAPVGQRAAVQ
jgi:hypothetical protein